MPTKETVSTLQAKAAAGTRIAMVTCYDYTSARREDTVCHCRHAFHELSGRR